jgi:hypothetical protein
VATREVLTPAQHARLSALPEMDERELARHHTLSEADLAAVSVRRGAANRISSLRGADTVSAGGGSDIVDVLDNQGVDTVSCGEGQDIVFADATDTINADCEDVR